MACIFCGRRDEVMDNSDHHKSGRGGMYVCEKCDGMNPIEGEET